jgi:hypothetical protein
LSAPDFGCFGFLGVFAFLSISNLLERESPDPHRAAAASVPRVVQSGAMGRVRRGTLAPGTFTPAIPMTGLRFFVTALPIGVQPKALDILGPDDSVLESVPL